MQRAETLHRFVFEPVDQREQGILRRVAAANSGRADGVAAVHHRQQRVLTRAAGAGLDGRDALEQRPDGILGRIALSEGAVDRAALVGGKALRQR